jgi:copper chaperone CopZ
LKAATEGRYTEAMALEQMYALLKAAGFAQDKDAIAALTALNPKIKFTDNLDDIIDKLKKIIEGKYSISIKASLESSTIPQTGISAGGIGPESTFDPAAVRKGDERSGGLLVSPPPVIVRPPTVTLPGEIGGEPFGVQPRPFIPDTGNFRFFDENDTSYLRLLNDQTSVPSNFDPARFRMRENDVTVNVNVSGSVISQNDLVAAVTDAVYQTQRTGNALVLADR